MAVGGEITIKSGTVPGSPIAGNVTLWADSNNILNVVDSDGNTKKLPDSTGWVPAAETWTYVSADDPSFVIDAGVDISDVYSLGMKIKCYTSGSGTFMGFITAIDGTEFTVYGGTDYDLANAAITLPYYSGWKAPYGFPLDPDKWSVISTQGYNTQTSPSASTYYNLGGSLNVPIGIWNIDYSIRLQLYTSTESTVECSTGLGLLTSTVIITSYAFFIDQPNVFIEFTNFNFVNVTSKTTYYCNMSRGATYTLDNLTNHYTQIRAVSAYL